MAFTDRDLELARLAVIRKAELLMAQASPASRTVETNYMKVRNEFFDELKAAIIDLQDIELNMGVRR